jgi:hypothetical protein
LAGYGVGPNLLRLQKKFWSNAKMVCHAGGNFGKPFSARRGVTQGGPLSSLMFNICVDAVVREWLRQCLGDNAAQGGIGEAVRDYIVAFFVDDRLAAARCSEWLQSSLTILVNLFECIGLKMNGGKDESHDVFAWEDMVCQDRGGVRRTTNWGHNNREVLAC